MAVKKKQKHIPVAYTINLTNIGGAIDYGGNNQLTVAPTDTLCWKSTTHAISITFKGKSPFKPDTPLLTASKNSPTASPIVKKPWKMPKDHPYTATISDGNTIIVEDPIIIIDDGGGGSRRRRGGGGKGAKKKAVKK